MRRAFPADATTSPCRVDLPAIPRDDQKSSADREARMAEDRCFPRLHSRLKDLTVCVPCRAYRGSTAGPKGSCSAIGLSGSGGTYSDEHVPRESSARLERYYVIGISPMKKFRPSFSVTDSPWTVVLPSLARKPLIVTSMPAGKSSFANPRRSSCVVPPV